MKKFPEKQAPSQDMGHLSGHKSCRSHAQMSAWTSNYTRASKRKKLQKPKKQNELSGPCDLDTSQLRSRCP